jgi:3-oxoacyl-[acyl-carrier protein] reductase
MMKLIHKTAIITGAATGIGKATAERFGEEGASVVINYLDDNHYTSVQESIARIESAGGKAIAVKADVSRVDQLTNLFQQAKETFGGIDVVVNNAVIAILKPIVEVTEEDYQRMFDVNVKSVFFSLQLAGKLMNDNGRVINLSSHTTALFFPNYGLYDANKGAVEQISRVFSKEIGHKGITVNVVSPGATDTAEFATRPQELKDRVKTMSGMNRIARQEEVVNVIAFLASDEASWVTGQNIKVNGGAI